MNIRAKEVPVVLFDQFTPLKEELFQFKGVDNEEYRAAWCKEKEVIIGCTQTRGRGGYFSFLKIARLKEVETLWNHFDITKVFVSPELEIAGGPFESGKWEKGRGMLLAEKVRVKFGNGRYGEGFAADTSFFRILTSFLYELEVLLKERKVMPLQYWEKSYDTSKSFDAYESATPKPQ